MPVADFGNDLEFGKRGELLFLSLHPTYKQLDGLVTDFITGDGITIELKTEKRSLQETKNYFIERYSDYRRKTPGGPWQAEAHKSDMFVYLFFPNKVTFFFKTTEIMSRLRQCITEGRFGLHNIVMVPNKGYTTAGWKVNREVLDDILQEAPK